MSYALVPYAVDLPALRAAIGSKSEGELEICEMGLDAERIDEIVQDQLAGEAAPGAHELLRHLIDGAPLDERVGSAYAYLLEHLCGTYGQRLGNDAWSPMSSSFFGELQGALAELGVPAQVLSVSSLINGRSPIELPLPDDFPAVGFWDVDEVQRVGEVLDGLELESVQSGAAREALAELKGWVRRCRGERVALVCFYY